MKLLTTLALAAAVMLPTAGFSIAQDAAKPTAAQCEEWFVKLDANKDGSVGADETKTLVPAANAGGAGTTSDTSKSMIHTKDQFVTDCQGGMWGMPTAG